MTKRRVSAKQRLELVQAALARFNEKIAKNGQAGPDTDDYVFFVDEVELALNAPLEPRKKEKSE